MAGELYLEDQYVKEFEAEVTATDGDSIFLTRTAFYPHGGGQPSDTGTITRATDGASFDVTAVQKRDGKIAHIVSREGLQAGDKVRGAIDWEKRHTLMRMHTTAHILSAIIHKNTGGLITGNQLGETQSRIDFDLEHFDKGMMDGFIEEANCLIKSGGAVTVGYVSREEAEKDPTLSKLAKGLPQGIALLRVISISDIDRQADGGTHVADIKEIGKVVFVDAKNKGKNNRRVYFTLDSSAVASERCPAQ